MADDGAPDGGKKVMGLDRRQLTILGAAAAAGVLFFWWRNRSANQSTSSDTTSASDAQSAYDQGLADAQNVAVTPYPVGGLTEQQLEDLEAAIAALQGKGSTTPPPPGGGGGTGGGNRPPGKPPTGPQGPPTGKGTTWSRYTIQRGDTPAKIAQKTHTSWAKIWAFNIGPNSPHSAAAKAKLIRETPSHLLSGQWLAIPK